MAGYSRTVKFNVPGTGVACVELPCPPRGKIDRLIVTQINGTPGGGTISIYDRKGACPNEVDLNVDESGAVTSIVTNGGFVQLTTDADHNLKVGDEIEIKDCTVAAYNTIHKVTEVVSSTVVVTDVSFTSGATDGVWQSSPFIPSVNPASSLVYTNSLTSGSLQAFDVDQHYENRDNQSETMRARHAGLWLYIDTANTGDYEVSITSEADSTL